MTGRSSLAHAFATCSRLPTSYIVAVEAWEQRCEEAVRLAPRAGEPDIAGRLLTLLLDPEDTAVSQAAGDALLSRRDGTGLALFAAAFAQADDDTRNKLGDCLYDDEGTLWADVRRMMPELQSHPSPEVRRGIDVLERRMRAEEVHHTASSDRP